MRFRRPPAVGVICLAALLVLTTPAHAKTRVDLGEDEVGLSDTLDRYREYRSWKARKNPLVDYAYARLCNVDSQHLESDIDGECSPPNGTVVLPGCDEDEPVMPLWRRTRVTVRSPWSNWEMRIGWACPDDLLPQLTRADFRRLTIEPTATHRQPGARGTVLVNKGIIGWVEPDERTFRTSLLDYGIDVVTWPVEYTWEFGDGHTLTTTSPGGPYPNRDVEHVYEQTGMFTVTLTTVWEGKYRVDEDEDHEWRAIDGTALTTATLAPFEVTELRGHLVG
ncbi:PKD domain-containing protein [Cellulomonas uda]|uniref:PKD domain-containing protein n=1 Tax=Cellulomonas uda TaxID=1714 RepID=A0A4Y3KBR4_CELUD|nr:PKD domain-containing protein [Cellulomonas uda]GEA81899.1 hypothetical protein CUD01_23430 [Cellulomonas uda]